MCTPECQSQRKARTHTYVLLQSQGDSEVGHTWHGEHRGGRWGAQKGPPDALLGIKSRLQNNEYNIPVFNIKTGIYVRVFRL